MHIRPFALFLAAGILSACVREPLLPGIPRSALEPGSHSRSDTSSIQEKTPSGEHVYLTAVRFPEGFNWELDTCAVDGTVLIDLYRDGEIIRSVPAGESLYPDRHRAAGGHLYADYTTASQTVVTRDGTELFRFDGREALKGFLVREDGVHTLGQDCDGKGFTYRVDGRTVYRSETGEVLGSLDRTGPPGGALAESGAEVCYACLLPSERGLEGRIMREAECWQRIPDAGSLMTFGLVDGKVGLVRKKPRQLLLEVDEAQTVLALRGGEAALWCRMAPWDGTALVLVCALGPGGKRYFLQTPETVIASADGETVSNLITGGSSPGWTVTDAAGNLSRVRWGDGGSLDPGPGAFLASGQCIRVHDGHLLLALTGRDGAVNRFQEDGSATEIPFNGYFTSVVVE